MAIFSNEKKKESRNGQIAQSSKRSFRRLKGRFTEFVWNVVIIFCSRCDLIVDMEPMEQYNAIDILIDSLEVRLMCTAIHCNGFLDESFFFERHGIIADSSKQSERIGCGAFFLLVPLIASEYCLELRPRKSSFCLRRLEASIFAATSKNKAATAVVLRQQNRNEPEKMS